MAKRLSFTEFDTKLKRDTLTPAEYRQYLEADPTAVRVRVRFKPGALRDAPPPQYNVDRELYLAERARREREKAFALVGLKRVLAEGDSWFNLPPFLWPTAIADRMIANKRVAVKNIARWGHTLAEMLERQEYLEEIRTYHPDWFIFSGGGNDLQESLARGVLLYTHDPNRPIEDCISPAGVTLLETIAEGYRTLLNQLAVKHPELPSICYTYDFPRPAVKGGKYIGQYLEKMGYPKEVWDRVAQVIINRLTGVVQPVVKAFPKSTFLDCRKATVGYAFFDDMHPDSKGFEALAYEFEQALGVVPARSTKRASLNRHASNRRRSSRGK